MPIEMPMSRPASVPNDQPQAIRESDAATCFQPSPSTKIVSSAATTWTGLGMMNSGKRPVDDASCQSAIMTAKASQGAQRLLRG